jgi:hypothetical protein
MHRRHLLLVIAATAAAPGAALADVQRTPLAKAFGLLDVYLGLPPSERSRFYLAYRAMHDKRPDPGAAATIVEANGARMPVPFDRGGLVLRLPTLAELKSAAVLESADPALHLGLELRAAITPAIRLDAAALVLAMAQVNAAVAKIAGPLALVAPKLTCAYFPDSGGGGALMADGRTAPLPVTTAPFLGPVPYFEPAVLAGARTVLLSHIPSRILLGAHPKKT